jgi:2-polyprenyl-3-methyl-5-hydroxy-6-metoxy-1,4-benzoquinol methylase
MKISEILLQYDTDKVKDHHYGDAYDELFSKFDREAPLNILEIGTQKGGSLCAWKDYFSNAKVTGIDIVDVVKPEYVRNDISYIISDIKEWKTDEMFDIIIDDGSHYESDVAFVIRYFTKNIKEGGLMIVEDIQDSRAWNGYELRRCGEQYDDLLLIIRK